MAGKVLVTGAAGFLGRHLIPALLDEGSTTVALCRRPEDLADLTHPALSIAAGDVRDASTCARLLAGVDTVFHLAAVRYRPGAAEAEMQAINEVATLRLVRQSVEAGVGRFVHVSTAAVFGPSSTPLDETSPLVADENLGSYAASKARAILALRELVGEGFPVITLYPTIVYGPDHPSRPNRVTSHIRRLLRRRFDVVISGGEARRDLVHVADVVAAMLAAAASRGAVGREFLIPGEPISQRGLAELVARCASRRPPLLVSVPMRPARIAAKLLDGALGYDSRSGWTLALDTLGREWSFLGARARDLLNHEPRPLARGVAQTVSWIRQESFRGESQ